MHQNIIVRISDRLKRLLTVLMRRMPVALRRVKPVSSTQLGETLLIYNLISVDLVGQLQNLKSRVYLFMMLWRFLQMFVMKWMLPLEKLLIKSGISSIMLFLVILD
uniref:Uncharacterized protein n=1 Tax=Meloidogyne enterolobii TaxID=390850 RepID=A0A6V7TYF8_MELEN|nr:unnamed protein product [Meloidogyne enterolobii]